MRVIQNINQAWRFHRGELKKVPKKEPKDWEEVSLPHTWNALDGQDGGFDYARDACWYVKKMKIPLEEDHEAYLEFCGANAAAEVYINGKKAMSHEGGFSTFRCNVTPFLGRGSKAVIAVMVDNREIPGVYPQTADFTFFGGLYRDVNLITVPKVHFDLQYHGAPGLRVTPVLNEDGSADVTLQAYLHGASGQQVRFLAAGQTVTADAAHPEAVLHLEHPHLWNGRNDPYLYTAEAAIVENGVEIDHISARFGVRNFHVDPEKGFFLNGASYPLHGVSRHQDRQDMGWAITKKEHREDMALICEVGANTIRLAHYQHDQYFYDLCDEYGMVVWAEIPFISFFQDSEKAKENTLSQMKELVLQNYNHPSIVCWGISNEITMGGISDALLANLRELNGLCHKLDSTRLTTLANLSIVPADDPVNSITDILSYNHYFGWYGGDVADNGPWLDDFHAQNPQRCLGVSEYGCEGILAYHSDTPRMQDYTEEYQAYYHEEMLKTFAARPYLWSTHVWNMFDFASDMRDEGGVKGRNNKGLVTFDRKIKKDSFYLYKAYWTREPFVHICQSRYQERASERITVKVYSNCPSVTLCVNGGEPVTVTADKVFLFPDTPLNMGENTLTASAQGCEEETICLLRVLEPNPAYTLEAEGEIKSGGAANWFEGLLEDGEQMEFPEGYFSIKDKISAIQKNPEGEKLIDKWMELAFEALNMRPSKGMINMARNFTIEKIAEMGGDRVPPGMLLAVNKELNKIKK